MCHHDAVPDSRPMISPPRQRRSRESFERVLRAAHGLLEDNGFEGFTIQEVAERSGVSVGAIYARFSNKEALLHAVHGRLMETMAAGDQAVRAAGDASGIGEALALAVAQMSRTMGEHRRALRAFMHLGAVDDFIAARGSTASIAQGRSFAEAMLRHQHEIRHPHPELAVDIAFRMVYSTLARQVMYGAQFESEFPVDWNTLTTELTLACRRYLVLAES